MRVLVVGNDTLFQALCGVFYRPDPKCGPRFETNPLRVCNRDAIDAAVTETFRNFGSVKIVKMLQPVKVPTGSIRSVL